MKIAVLAPLAFPIREPYAGGLEKHTAELAEGLARRGHAVTLFARPGSVVAGGASEDVAKPPSVAEAADGKDAKSPMLPTSPAAAAAAGSAAGTGATTSVDSTAGVLIGDFVTSPKLPTATGAAVTAVSALGAAPKSEPMSPKATAGARLSLIHI